MTDFTVPAITAKGGTDAQRLARQRNWHVRNLRGLYARASALLTGDRREAALAAIDAELEGLGAEPDTRRNYRLAMLDVDRNL